jgi:TonB family protein
MSKPTLISFRATSCGVLLAAGWLALHPFTLEGAPVTQEDGQVNPLQRVAPNYPQAAQEKHIEGAVVLEIQIDAEGRVSRAQAVGGPEELRSAALEAVLQWRYSPQAMTLPAATQVTVDFKLPQGAVADSKISPTPAGATPPTRIRVGGSVQQAKLLVKAKPVYPPKAKAKGIQGMVRLEATIARDGKVGDLKVLSGNALLATAAVDAVRQQRYATTILDGAPVEVVTEIDVNFTLIAPQPTQTYPSYLAAHAAGRPVTSAPW